MPLESQNADRSLIAIGVESVQDERRANPSAWDRRFRYAFRGFRQPQDPRRGELELTGVGLLVERKRNKLAHGNRALAHENLLARAHAAQVLAQVGLELRDRYRLHTPSVTIIVILDGA